MKKEDSRKALRNIVIFVVLALPVIGGAALAFENNNPAAKYQLVRITLVNVKLFSNFLSFDTWEPLPSGDGHGGKNHQMMINMLDIINLRKKLGTDILVHSVEHNVAHGPHYTTECRYKVNVELDVQKRGDEIVGYGMLYINGKPWREFDEREAYAKLEECERNLK